MKRTIGCFLAALVIGLWLLPAAGQGQAQTEMKTVFNLTDEPSTSPFSPAILVKDTLYVSGQLPVDPQTGQLAGTTMAEQADRAIRNVEILVKRAGLALSDVVQTTVYITDFDEFAAFNEVFKKFFPTLPPTRATVQVSKLARDAKIEISAVAVVSTLVRKIKMEASSEAVR
jgi:2-iminobutanoate/2-iminopropanoate deaminase